MPQKQQFDKSEFSIARYDRRFNCNGYYVIWDNGKIVSRAAIWKYSQTKWEVAAVSSLPEYRGKGYGEMLVGHCTAIILSHGKVATCTTNDTNIAIRGLLEKVGFTETKQTVLQA